MERKNVVTWKGGEIYLVLSCGRIGGGGGGIKGTARDFNNTVPKLNSALQNIQMQHCKYNSDISIVTSKYFCHIDRDPKIVLT